MIFKQISEIVAGTKTQTRRVIKPGEKYFGLSVYTAGGRIKWRVGQDYAVVPKRGQKGIYYNPDTLHIFDDEGMSYANMEEFYTECQHGKEPEFFRQCMLNKGNVPLRIKILDIPREPLQAISREDAQREGVGDVGEYRKLWESINNRPGIRWTDNPFVWVIDFEVLKPGGNK